MEPKDHVKIYCDNKAAISIAHNPIQRDQIKHIEVDRRFIKEKIESKMIFTPFVTTKQQFVDIFIKGISSIMFVCTIGKFDSKLN